MLKKFVLILFICIFSINILSINIDFEKNIDLNKEIKFDAIALSSLTISGLLLDSTIQNFNKLDLKEDFIDTKIIALTSCSLFLSSFIFDDEKFYKTSLYSFESTIFSGGLTYLLKNILGRARPYTNNGPYDYELLRGFHSDDYRSMPSGHSALSWALITPYAENYNKLLYAIPATISIMRILENKHFTSDVVLGSFIGYLSGKYINKLNFEISF